METLASGLELTPLWTKGWSLACFSSCWSLSFLARLFCILNELSSQRHMVNIDLPFLFPKHDAPPLKDFKRRYSLISQHSGRIHIIAEISYLERFSTSWTVGPVRQGLLCLDLQEEPPEGHRILAGQPGGGGQGPGRGTSAQEEDGDRPEWDGNPAGPRQQEQQRTCEDAEKAATANQGSNLEAGRTNHKASHPRACRLTGS